MGRLMSPSSYQRHPASRKDLWNTSVRSATYATRRPWASSRTAASRPACLNPQLDLLMQDATQGSERFPMVGRDVGNSGELNPFLDGARELVEKLRESRDHAGTSMLARAARLAGEFDSWRSSPPDGRRKSEAISELIGLTREVNERLVHERDEKAHKE